MDEQGVYYAHADYIGIWRRLIANALDFFLLMVVTVILGYWLVPTIDQPQVVLGSFLALWFVYLVVIKRTYFGTLGLALVNARVVDLAGNRPSIFRMLFRFLFLVFGPINILFDIIWLGGDAHRQSIRDKFAGTYVIKKSSHPSGSGRQVMKTYCFMGWTFNFREVDRVT